MGNVRAWLPSRESIPKTLRTKKSRAEVGRFPRLGQIDNFCASVSDEMSIPKNLDKIRLKDFEVQEFRSIINDSVEEPVDFALLDQLAAIQPPFNNMGATYPVTPLFIPHGEKSGVKDVQKTSIDWLAYSSLSDIEALMMGLQVVWPEMTRTASKAGMRGYPKCNALVVDGVQFGLLGHGAKHGRASVSLTGVACKTLSDSHLALMHEMLSVVDARLSRVDICFDFYQGECTLDYAMWCFDQGEFRKPKANCQPKKSIVASTGGYGENLGRTLYIGQRDGELYGRIYEKGLEVFANMPEEYREACTDREWQLQGDEAGKPIGTIADTWVRLEAEFKRKHKDRPLALEMLLDRDAYFAGAYPFFARMLGKGDGKGRGSIPSDRELAHDRLIMAHRASYGNHVHSLRKIGFTDTEIANMLDTGVHNQRLLKSGLVTVETEAVRKFRCEDQTDADIPF